MGHIEYRVCRGGHHCGNNTTGDVRGTYALQSASDGTKRLVLYVSPSVANLSNATNLPTGLFGVAQNLASNNGA